MFGPKSRITKLVLTRFICLLVCCVFAISQTYIATTSALSSEQKRLYNKNILYYDIDACGGGGSSSSTTGNSTDVDKFLKALAFQESGGDPTQPGSAGSARGKYQYIDSTWQARFNSYEPASKYNQAHLAPEAVQDAVAYIEYAQKFKELNNDIFKLAVSHFYPIANSDPSKLDIIPPSNVITPRQYAEHLINSIKKGGKWEKIPLKYTDAPEFAKWAEKAGISAGNPSGAASISGSSVYILGDSITLGAKNDLKSELVAKDFKPYINASQDRSIAGKGSTDGAKTSGLEAVAEDKERIKNAGSVIIALGTNPENNFEDSVKNLVSKVKDANPDAEIYWVNIFSTGGSTEGKKYNKILEKIQSSETYQIINTLSEKIELGPDDVHPTPAGSKTFAKTIANSLDSGTSAADALTSDCSCGTSGNSSSGSNNTEIAYNFLVSKGLEPMHAAAMVGNFIHESGGDPLKTNNPNPSSGATGIAHWLGGRLTGLYSHADKQGDWDKGDWKDIDAQLDYLWEVDLPAQEKGGFPALTELKKTGDLASAVAVFERLFERSGDTGSYSTRTKNAQNVLTEYGSGSSTSSSNSGTSACTTDSGSEQVTGEYSLPVDKKWYEKNPVWFTKPHHDHPAADIPVPRGTPVYSVTAGKIISAPNEGGYGLGLTIVAPDGVQYEYGHGTDGGSVKGAKQGDTVKAGQLIMHVNNTGSSQGDHLHLSIRINGQERCPQKLFVSIAEGKPIDPKSLPTSGCTY